MPITLVQSATPGTNATGATATTSTGAFSSANTAHNAIICGAVLDNESGTTSVQDSAGNTYTLQVRAPLAGNRFVEIWACFDIVAYTSNVVTLNQAFCDSVFFAQEYSGLKTSGTLGETGVNAGTSATSPTVSTTVSTTTANQLVISVLELDKSVGHSIDSAGSGYSNLQTGSSNFVLGAIESKIVYETGVQTATMNVTNPSNSWRMAIATFRGETQVNEEIETHYVYKSYSGTTFAGLLTNVISEFEISHQLNQAGCQLNIDLGISLDDVGATADIEYLIDENSNFVVDSDGNNIYSAIDYIFDTEPIDLGNRIVVTKYNSDYPDGVTVFDGIVTSWHTDLSRQSVGVTVISHGVRLDNYILNTDSDLSVEQAYYDSEIALNLTDIPSGSGVRTVSDYVAQSFQVITNIDAISVEFVDKSSGLTGNCYIQFDLYEGLPTSPGALLYTAAYNITNTDWGVHTVQFDTPISLVTGTDYFFQLSNIGQNTSGYSTPSVGYQASNLYASGSYYDNIANAGYVARTRDLAFIVNSTTGSVDSSFLNSDPTELATTGLTIFNSQGGIVTYSSDTIVASGESIDYTFKLGTIWEALQRAYELCPSTYVLFVDPATNLVHLKPRSSDPDHIFINGKHLNDIHIERTIENIKNTVYFSGGDDGTGSNIFMRDSNSLSVQSYGQWLDRLSDNRVTNTDTASTFISSDLARNSNPNFRCTISIPASEYDIDSINLGDMVGFAGFNNLIDELLLSVVSYKKGTYYIELGLGQVFPRQSKRLEKLSRDMIQQQTINNPSIVS